MAFKTYIEGVGIEVREAFMDCHGYVGIRPIINFGDRQSDAIEFVRDLNSGRLGLPEKMLLRRADVYNPKEVYRYDGLTGKITLVEIRP